MTAPLAFPHPPAQYELASSYIRRLATLHGIEPSDLWLKATSPVAPGDRRRTLDPARMAILTGRPVEYLAGALPQLRATEPDWRLFRHRPQAGCVRCDARHPGGGVLRVLPHHRYVCLRHNHWIGPPDLDRPSFSLDRLPEITRAQHKHHRLTRLRGFIAAYDGVLTGFLICAGLWNSPARYRCRTAEDWDHRAELLVPAGQESASFSASRMFAAIYPEAVTIAALIAAPDWRKLAHGCAAQRERFDRAISRMFGLPVNVPEARRGIDHWANIDSHYPPAEPPKTVIDTRWHQSPNTPGHGQSEVCRHAKSAHWFALNREGGRAVLFHQHIKPVVQRPHAPDMAEYRGAVHVAQSPHGLLGHSYPHLATQPTREPPR